MDAAQLFAKSIDPSSWRKHSRALRRSADVLWDTFAELLTTACAIAKKQNTELNVESALDALETAKLLYGLALETALKAWLIEHHPAKVEIRLTMTGDGLPKQAELKSFGLPTNQGHNLLALAEAVGVFGPNFSHVVKTESDGASLKTICRDLGEVVVWRGRYPVPMTSFEPISPDPKVPSVALGHYLRDWLDPLLDALLFECASPPKSKLDDTQL